MSDRLAEALAAELASRYAIEGELGRGSSATVYLARDLRHGRRVALKLLHAQLGEALGAERFQREIRTLARLQHPHILPLLDSGIAGGRLFYTMPYVEGGSLRDRLARDGPLAIETTVRLVAQIASALTCAHAFGILHRDIKPANILLSAGGDALLTDFGIAAAIGQDPAGRLTESGIALGTPAYMSPEQSAGDEPVDARSDVYALATVAYEALAGRPPFTGRSARAVLASRLTGTPDPLAELRPDLPAGVLSVIMRGLARRPEERFESAAELAGALAEGAAPAPAAGVRRTPGLRAAGIGALALLATVALLTRARHSPESPARTTGPVVLAVLPFRNVGSADDRYFADGLTEEITGRLAGVSGLRVISRTSADQYRASRKPLKRIGEELGAGYILEGSVGWDHGDGGAGRIRIRPRLVRATDDTELWAESYEAEPGGVLALQAALATRVSDALGIALREPERAALGLVGTSNAQAYDFYLRGNDYVGRGNTEAALRSAIQLYRQAIALDSGYAQAWARLARVSLQIYWYHYDHTEAGLRAAKEAADAARRLGPELPETHMALGFYHYWGRLDYDQAIREFQAALRVQPSNPDLLQAIGYVERRRGRWEASLDRFQEALRYDPRSGVRHFEVGDDALALHRYEEAERYFDQAILLSPEWADPYVYKAWLYVCWRGDTARARAVMRRAFTRIEPERVVVAASSGDLVSASLLTADSVFWPVLDRITVTAFPGDPARYHLIKAELESFRGHPAAQRAHGDSARRVAEPEVARNPDDAKVLGRLALAYAYAGRADDAVRAGKRVVELLPVSRDGVSGFFLAAALARIYGYADRPADAAGVLRELLVLPGLITPAALRADPAWGRLRDQPSFRALLADSAAT